MLGQSIRIVILLGRLACSFQVSNGRFPALMCFVSFSPKRWRALRMVWRVVLMTFYVLSAIVPTSPIPSAFDVVSAQDGRGAWYGAFR
jgi:hypothetical protein